LLYQGLGRDLGVSFKLHKILDVNNRIYIAERIVAVAQTTYKWQTLG
jgi:hypothetical protein